MEDKFLNKLEEVYSLSRSLDLILERIDIEYNEKEQIEKNIKLLEKFITKLKKNIIEIAVAGTEKSGKSAFVNAFIGKPLMPSKVERATYIPTEVRYSPELKVIVKFYTEEEYIKQVLRPLLKDMKIPNYEKYTLDNLEQVKGIINDIEENNPEHFKVLFQGNYIREFNEIFEGRNEIKKFLTGGQKVFSGKSIDKKEYEPFITHKAKSRAVKEVIILSPELKDLENVIIYDLPGFDSPTVIHSKFTIEKLKSADAVVYIRSAEKPNLVDSEVRVLTQSEEEGGYKLKYKLFFFLNKADKFTSKEELEEYLKAFKRDLERYDLFLSSDRIVIGSAYARLVELGYAKEKEVLEKLRKFGLTDGIDEIRKKLIDYAKSDRRAIIIEKIKTILRDIVKNLNKVKDELERIGKEGEGSILIKYEQELRRKFSSEVKDALNKYYQELKEETEKNKEISQEILRKYDIELAMPPEDIVNSVRFEVIGRTYGTSPKLDAYDFKLRDKLFSIIRDKIHELPEAVVIRKQEEVREKVINIILNIVKPENRGEFRIKLEEFIDKNLKNYLDEIYGIKVLFMRFVGNFMEWLIRSPRRSSDRIATFNEIFNDFSYYLTLHSDAGNKITNEKKYEYISDLTEKFKDLLREKVPVIFIQNLVKKNEIEKIENDFRKLPIEYQQEILQELERKKEITLLDVRMIINEKLKKMAQSAKVINYEENNLSPADFLKQFFQIFKMKHEEAIAKDSRKNFEDVEREIEEDLEEFKKLIRKALIYAINPEKAFVITSGDFINKLIELFESKEGDEFFRENLEFVYFSKIKNIEQVRKRAELAKQGLDILQEINEKIKAILYA